MQKLLLLLFLFLSLGAFVLIRRKKNPAPSLVEGASQAPTKLYCLCTVDGESDILWEVDKVTGELTEIVKLPDAEEDFMWKSPIVDPATGSIYLYQWINSERGDFDLYRVDPEQKTLHKIGSLNPQTPYDSFQLYIIDGKLHTLIEKPLRNSETGQREYFLSLVSIDPNTAEQTLVADFGTVHQVLNISANLWAEKTAYDPVSKDLFLPFCYVENDCKKCLLAKWNWTKGEIVVGETFDYDCIFLEKEGNIYGFFKNGKTTFSNNIRPIDPQTLKVGKSIDTIIASEPNDFCYDAETKKVYSVRYNYCESANTEWYTLISYDFKTKKTTKIKKYPTNFCLWELFN